WWRSDMSAMRRRDFLRSALCATAASGAFASIWPKLALAGAPYARLKGMAGDYRALVCVYLAGGNDSFSTLVPISGLHRTHYENARQGNPTGETNDQTNPSDLRLPSAQLLQLNGLSAEGSPYGLHPQMPGLRQLFNEQRAAIVANVGPLIRPL